jgi:D-3-phosphoglycerate dehydrogenase
MAAHRKRAPYMKIAVIDKIQLDDKNRRRLESLGELIIYEDDSPSRDDTVNRLGDAKIGIISASPIDTYVFGRCPDLKMLSLYSTGYNHINIDDANAAHVTVCNVPGYSTVSVAEFIFGALQTLNRHIREADRHIRDGLFDWYAFRGGELAGKVLGIYGTGSIGCHAARIAHGYGMKVIAVSRTESSEKAQRYSIEYVTFRRLLGESDVIAVTCAATPETIGRFSDREFAAMKRSAFFINTSRGSIVDYHALIRALKNCTIAGACIDVYPEEPPRDMELFTCDNVILSPHIAYNTQEALQRLTDTCVDNIVHFIEGRPTHIVNKP